MDYNSLLDIAIELGYRLAMSGAETFRIEESITRVMDAYGITAEAFAIPNCLHVSIKTPDKEPMTRMRRIGHHGNDLDAVEKYSNLSRRICSERPNPQLAMQWLEETESSRKQHSFWMYLLGNFMGGCGFALLFNGSMLDCILGSICGLIIGFVNQFMDNFRANPFFRTIIASFIMAIFAYFTHYLWPQINTESVITGALMILVPGLLFTNAMRDIIYGDTNSGVNRIVLVFLISAGIALGTGAAWKLADSVWGVYGNDDFVSHNIWIESVACFVGCIGFTVLFNIHGKGGCLCAVGGILTWVTFRLVLHLTKDTIAAYFWGAVCASLYAEIMARIRKCPAISYLVISAFPLLPGAGVYNTMKYAVRGNMTDFVNTGMTTIAIAGVMAVGILLVTATVRIINVMKIHNK